MCNASHALTKVTLLFLAAVIAKQQELASRWRSEVRQCLMVQARSMAAKEQRTVEVHPAANSPPQPASSSPGAATAATDQAGSSAGSSSAASSHQSVPAGGAQSPGASAAEEAGAGAEAARGRPPRMQRTAQLFRELRERHDAPSPAWLVIAPLVQVGTPLTRQCTNAYRSKPCMMSMPDISWNTGAMWYDTAG
jgi:hypothetical protein